MVFENKKKKVKKKCYKHMSTRWVSITECAQINETAAMPDLMIWRSLGLVSPGATNAPLDALIN